MCGPPAFLDVTVGRRARRGGVKWRCCYLLEGRESIWAAPWVPAFAGTRAIKGERSLGGDAHALVLVQLGEAARQRFALGIEERRRPRARDGVDALLRWDAS